MILCLPFQERRGLLSLLTGAMVAALLLGTQAVGQTNQPSMDVGTVRLNLGMPRDRVLALVKQAGYKFLELAPEGKENVVAVTLRDIADPVQQAMVLVDNEGKLFFRDGALVRIQKEIADSINTDRDLAFVLYAIVQGLEKEGDGHLCSVSTTDEISHIDSPAIEAKTILLDCSVGSGTYSTTHIRWVTMDTHGSQLHVAVFQELWRR